MVTSVDVYKEIRRLQLGGVTSQRRAAALLGISRNTMKKYWEGNAVPWERQTYEREAAVLTPEVVRFIENCLEADAQERVRKQHHTARRIYNRLVEECGFTGSESSIRKAVHKLRAQRSAVETYVPLRFVPGSAMQVDWGEAAIYLGGQRMAVNLFCARLCFSCAPFVIAYDRQNLESFLDALTRAIQFFGGVPRQVIFDNARVAVKSGFGAHAVAQEDYAQFAAHYGFEPVFCNPASGNEKGMVENLVGYIRRNVCVPHVDNIYAVQRVLQLCTNRFYISVNVCLTLQTLCREGIVAVYLFDTFRGLRYRVRAGYWRLGRLGRRMNIRVDLPNNIIRIVLHRLHHAIQQRQTDQFLDLLTTSSVIGVRFGQIIFQMIIRWINAYQFMHSGHYSLKNLFSFYDAIVLDNTFSMLITSGLVRSFASCSGLMLSCFSVSAASAVFFLLSERASGSEPLPA